jgi:RecB family exonuclease
MAETTTEEIKPLERYSYSKISTYKQCPFKFKLKYEDKNYLFSANIATDFGSLVHAIEEEIALAIRSKQSINYIALKNKFIIESRKLAQKYPTEFFNRDKSGRTYQEKVYLYLDSAIYRLEHFLQVHPELRIIGIEQKFEYDYDGVHSFNGSIDRAFQNINTGELLIQDIKTWSVPAQTSELKAPLQFAVYMMAAEKLWDVSIDKIRCEYDLPLCDITQPALSEDIVEQGRSILDKLFKGIHNENFKPTITALCHWCEYNPLTNPSILETKPEAVCPYFSTWQKSGDNVRDTLVSWQGLSMVKVDQQFCISQLKQQALIAN